METLRVLVIDDEPGMRTGVERALRNHVLHLSDIGVDARFDIACAESGEQGLERIREQAPDILLLDHKLPGMSGLDVLEHVGRRDGMVTVMITAYASLEAAVSAIKLGAYDFLAKPFTPKELKATVNRAAESLVLARQARKLAEEKRQVRFQFIRVLAHELKAPLNAVEGFMDIVINKTAGENPEMYDDMLRRGVKRIEQMRKLIMDLLDLTRIESGQKSRAVEELDLAELVRDTVETMQPAADERSITFAVTVDEPLPMLGDSGELQIILNNLVSNAVKYNRDGGEVRVSVEANEETVTLAVADTGIGMSPAEKEKLFGDFVRIKNAKTRGILGSGLGLAILKKLTSLYDGTIDVESTPDVGTTFTVRLKRYLQPTVTGEEEEASEADTAASAEGVTA